MIKNYKQFNESVKDMLKPMSKEVIESMFPPIVDEVKKVLSDNNIKYDIGLDRMYSEAPIEIYFEIGEGQKKTAYQLEVFRDEDRWLNKYRLGTFMSSWKKLYKTSSEDLMVDFIKGLFTVKEGSETVGIVGSGQAVSGYPNGNTFTKSAGQAVYGWDSDSAFAGSSNNTSVKIEVEKGERIRFKDMKQKKKKKNKEVRLNNQIGKDIDDIHKPKIKTNNEHMKTKFDNFIKEEVDYEFMRKMNRDDNTPRYVGGFDRFIKLKDDDLKTRTSKLKSDKPTKPIESEFVDRKLFNGERAAIKYEKYNDFIDDIYTNIDNLIQEYKMEKVLMFILLFISHVNGGLVSRKKVFEFIECCDEKHGQKLRKLCWDYTYGKTETDRKFSSWHYIGLSFQRAMEELILTDETELNDVPDKNRRISSIYKTTQKQVEEFDNVMKEYRLSGKIELDDISTKTIKIRRT